MSWLEEISRSLAASFRLLIHDEKALWNFNLTTAGFWRSFVAIIIVAPLYILLSRSSLGTSTGIEKYSILTILGRLVLQWGIWLAIMAFVLRQIKLTKHYVRYVVVYNWTTVVVMVFISLPFIGFQMELMENDLTLFYVAVLQLLSYYFSWYITRISLETSGLIAFAIILGEHVTSVFLLTVLA
jgi:hypothetical protein